MWRMMSGVFLCVLLLLQAAYSQPDAGPGMAGGEPTPQLPKLPAELGAAHGAINRLNNRAEKIDLSSPEATVRSFVWAFNNNDLEQARRCVANAAPIENLKPLQEMLGKQMGKKYAVLSLKDLRAYTQQDNAIVTFWLDFVSTINIPNYIGSSERLRLKRVNNEWLIVPQQDGKTPFWDTPPRPMMEDLMDLFIAKMTDGAAVQSESQFHQCQSNLKQIALGVLQYTQDFDEFFPAANEWQEQIMPYVRNGDIYVCPDAADKTASYAFNKDVENLALGDIRAPAQIILMYEGKDRKFEFRHQVGEEKLTNIVFVDGHVKSFSQTTLDTAFKDQSVRWNP